MRQALSGIRVLEWGEMVSAPYCAKLLADMGAEVIKVERPVEGDRARRMGPFPNDKFDLEQSGLHLFVNANKRGITLDWSRPQARDVVQRLVAKSDVLIHNFAPRELEMSGLVYEQLRAINPALVMTSITPFGLHGPYRDFTAEDLTSWCAGGNCYISGVGNADADVPPVKTFGHPAGYAGGAHAAVATMGAVIGRRLNGVGAHVEVVLQEVLAAIGFGIMEWPVAGTIGTRLGEKVAQPAEAMRARDGWVFVQAGTDAQFRMLVQMMGSPPWIDDPAFGSRTLRAKNWTRLQPLLQDWVGRQSTQEFCAAAQKQRIPVVPVSTMEDLLHSAHLEAHQFFVALDHPRAGKLDYPGGFAHYSATPWQIRRAAPMLGQHNAEVFMGELGYSQREFDGFAMAEVI